MSKFQISWDKGKKKAQPTKDKNRWRSLGKELGWDTWGFPRAWDPRDMQQKPEWIKTVQGGAEKHKEQE